MKKPHSNVRSELGTRARDWSALALGIGAGLLAACTKGQSESHPRELAPSVASATPYAQAAVTPASATQASSTLLSVGAALPDISAPDQSGAARSLREFSGKPLVVYFYPKDDTPGCTLEAQEIRDLFDQIRQTGANVVGISMDDSASHRAFAEKHALPFALLADPDRSLARAFGVPLNEKGRSQRVSFVFGRDGKLAKVFERVTPAGHGRELLDELKSLGS